MPKKIRTDFIFEPTAKMTTDKITGPTRIKIKEENRIQDHQVYLHLWPMKGVHKQSSLNLIEIHAPTFDSNINGGSDRPYPTHHDVCSRANSELHT